jgi:hypothetical protein
MRIPKIHYLSLALAAAALALSLYSALPTFGRGVSHPLGACNHQTHGQKAKSRPTGHTLLNISGSGAEQTPYFTPHGSEWQIHWSYDCHRFGDKGNFQIYIEGQGEASFNVAANALGWSGHGTDYEHAGGHYYLSINSECDWHVWVTG